MGERCRLYMELKAGAKGLVLENHREQQRTERRHSWAMFGVGEEKRCEVNKWKGSG